MSVLRTFFGPGNDLAPESLGPDAAQRLDPWLTRWREGHGPAFLPRRVGSRLLWYGLVDDDVQRRELQHLLRFWVGPSCSDVVERQGALDLDDPFDRDLDSQLPGRVVRVEVWPRGGGQGPEREVLERVRRRLEGLVRMLDERPLREERTAASLPALLDELDLAATSGDARRAHDLLEELERRRLLDAPNTTFAEVRVQALLGRYDEVLAPELLQQLDGLHLPPGIVLHIARATYEVHLRGPDLAAEVEALLHQRETLPPVLRHVLRQGPSFDERPVLVARAVVVGDEPGMATHLAPHLPGDLHLQALLGRPLGGVIDAGAPDLDPDLADRPDGLAEDLDTRTDRRQDASLIAEMTRLHQASAHEAVIDIARRLEHLPPEVHELIVLSAHELEDEWAARDAVIILERDIGPAASIQWPTKLIRGAFDELVARTRSTGTVVRDWSTWFETAASGLAVPPEQEACAADWPPLSRDRLLDLIETVEPHALARVFGRLRAAHEPLLDVGSRGALARKALMMLALSDRSDSDVRLSGRELVGAVLDSGVASGEVEELLETVLELIRTQLSAGTLAWGIDLMVDITGELALTAPEAMAASWYRFFDFVRVFASSVARARWLEIAAVTEQVGVALPADIAARLEADESPDPLACLEGRRIFLYSLRERAARQAAGRLQSVGAEVEISSVHVGSSQLSGQVEGADLVVVVTAAAKHAATEFIEEAARGRVIHVNSAGMSAILMAMEELCAA